MAVQSVAPFFCWERVHLRSIRNMYAKKQGCQMAYFQFKNPNLGKFGRVLQIEDVCWFCGQLVCMYVYVFAIWYILPNVGVCCTMKNLATLLKSGSLKCANNLKKTCEKLYLTKVESIHSELKNQKRSHSESGLPDLSWHNIPKRWKYNKWPENWPNRHKMYIPLSSIARSSKIYPNWDFLFENIPSGNPDSECG
jgi:hypothetical protein